MDRPSARAWLGIAPSPSTTRRLATARSPTARGHKAHLAVEATSGIITAVDVSAPGEADGALVETLLSETAAVTEREVAEALGDSAYSFRTALEAAGRVGVELITKMPGGRSDRFGAADFKVSADGTRARCPAGASSVRVKHRQDGLLHVWDPERCGPCPPKERGTPAASRTLLVAPDFHDRRRRERYARSKRGRRRLRRRVAVEASFARATARWQSETRPPRNRSLAALVLYWPESHRQIRVTGSVRDGLAAHPRPGKADAAPGQPAH